MTDLAARFAEQQASEIEWNGPLFSLYELPSETTHVTIEFESAGSGLRQGVRLKARGGLLTINGAGAADQVLWEDSAPGSVQVDVAWSGRGERSLRIWNTWMWVTPDGDEVAQAWLGNAGMRVSSDGGSRYVLRCSDGVGEPTFDDLVVAVTVR